MCAAALDRLQNIRYQRVQQLEQRMQSMRGVARFADWVQQNGSAFKAPVYGPVCAEVNVPEQQHQFIVQQAIPSASADVLYAVPYAPRGRMTAAGLRLQQNEHRGRQQGCCRVRNLLETRPAPTHRCSLNAPCPHTTVLSDAVLTPRMGRAVGVWARFVVQHDEDKQRLTQEARQRFNLRITVSNFRGNPAQAIAHPLGDAAHFTRCSTLAVGAPTSRLLKGRWLPHALGLSASRANVVSPRYLLRCTARQSCLQRCSSPRQPDPVSTCVAHTSGSALSPGTAAPRLLWRP